MRNLKAIILAAGEGSRMKSKTSKVLHKVMDKAMVQRVVDVAKKTGAHELAIIVGYKAEKVREAVTGDGISFFVQQQQLGTGHAVMQAIDFIKNEDNYIILYGDTPLIREETLKKLLAFHEKNDNGVSIISAVVEDSSGYGHIIRDDSGNFLKNVEYKDCTKEEKNIKEINTGIYCYKGNSLKKALKSLKNDNIQGEYYLPDTLEIILKNGENVDAVIEEDASEFFGVNSRVQLATAEEILRRRINEAHMENGVTMISPEQTYIADDVVIGRDTIIYPGTFLAGNTIIGEDCEIGPNCRLTNVEVGTGTKIQFSTAMNSYIGEDTVVGPYAYIRPGSKIGNNVKVGDFVEVKNSVIGDGTKISHLTYVGDSDVGERVNFGCGTVTVNYDGKNKFRTIIKDDVFIGCNANLIAPVILEKESYIGAGSTITKNVPEKALGIARNRQENLNGWSKK